MLVWLALRTTTRASWARLSFWRTATRHSLDDKVASTGISNIEFGGLNNYHLSGRPDDDDGASGGEGCIGDATATNQNSQADRPYPVPVTNLVQYHPEIPGGGLEEKLPKGLKAPGGCLPRPYLHRYSATPSLTFTILSRLQLRTQIKTKIKHISKSANISTTINDENDAELLEHLPSSFCLCISSTVRVF
ncbi:hypothetical protein BDZ45DRAFT_416779 [Acephala macrosclerotiorum]|nr:hypothetical protein BDZ45DRAFT_416779 [Acephala macrosclerotiorum]